MPRLRPILLCLCLITLPAAAAATDERNCTAAIESARKAVNELPAASSSEKERLKELKERQEKIISDERAKGSSECQIWNLIMGYAFKQ